MLGSEMPLPGVLYGKDDYKAEVRDPCASPPCKRLKQGSINFPVIIDDDATQQTTGTTNSHNDLPDTGKQSPTTLPNSTATCNHQVENGPHSVDNTNETSASMETESPETDRNTTTQLAPSSTTLSNNVHKSNSPDTTLNSNVETKITKQCHSSRTPIKSGILKFAQPVTPGRQPNDRYVAVTPPPPVVSKDVPSSQSSPVILTTPIKQNESPQFVATPHSDSKNTPTNKTPKRKLSVEEKRKREEERLKKQKEKDQQEQERLEKKKEKERLKEEKEKERQEEKKRKEQERLEQLELKKQRDKEKQEKKEQEDKEKQEKLEKKEEEKRKKDEEKRKRDEEKNYKIEEKRKKEEEESLKKQRVQNSFAKFFIKKEATSVPKQKELVKIESKFQPFELKPFMKLASTKPVIPLSERAKETLNQCLIEQPSATSMYLLKEELKKINEEVTRKRHRVIDLTNNREIETKKDNDDIMIIDDVVDDQKMIKEQLGVKPKLLQFHENYRPAYFGTWRKKSKCVGPRRPLKKDTELMNYEVDSDEEWEEEEPGESLSDSEGEEEEKDGVKEDVENDEENDGFFVPHGYLSDDEGAVVDNKEEGNEDMDCAESSENAKPPKIEDRMERQLAKQKVWETEMKRQFKPMKPIAIGCIWGDKIPAFLKQLEACSLVNCDTIDPTVNSEIPDKLSSNNSPCSTTRPVTPSTLYSTAMPVPEEAMPSLIQFVHGNTDGLTKIMKMFRKKWTLETKKDDSNVTESNWQEHCAVSKRQIERRISEMAKKEKRPILPKARWYVHHSVLAKYNMEDIRLPTTDCHFNKEEPLLLSKAAPNIKHFTQHASSPDSHGQNETKDDVAQVTSTL